MTKTNDYVTKKDLQVFGNKLEKKIVAEIDSKLDKKLGDLLDVKFAEYFDIIISAVNKNIDQKLDVHKTETSNSIEKLSYYIDLHESHLIKLDLRLDSNTNQINNLEKKVFGSVTA